MLFFGQIFNCGHLFREPEGIEIKFPGRFQHLRDRGGSQRSFPDSANSHDGPLGQESFEPHPGKAARHAKAVLRPR